MHTFRTSKLKLHLLFLALIIIDCRYSFGLFDLFLELINLLEIIQSKKIVLLVNMFLENELMILLINK